MSVSIKVIQPKVSLDLGTPNPHVIEVSVVGRRGPQGMPGVGGSISATPGNIISNTQDGLYAAPEWKTKDW